MSIYLEFFLVFVSIGLFCFGGGYVIIPLIQQEVVNRGWMLPEEFINIIAVSESTPGPLAVNAATYVGFKLSGLTGAFVCTLSLILPAFFLALTIGEIWNTDKGKAFFKRIMVGIKPVVTGLIFAAAVSLMQTIWIVPSYSYYTISWSGVFLALAAYIGIRRFALHPVFIILVGAIFGVLCI
ncbi:MAG: chromate transporter [Peptococcaceae bacterium]|nr:chromate transporter [Peptococcaceae bacterium]